MSAPLRRQKHRTTASHTLTDLDVENRVGSRTLCISYRTSVGIFSGSPYFQVEVTH